MSNKGLSYDYILGKLPRTKHDIFINASTSWDIGGCCGALYFMVPLKVLNEVFPREKIARKELLAALGAVQK